MAGGLPARFPYFPHFTHPGREGGWLCVQFHTRQGDFQPRRTCS